MFNCVQFSINILTALLSVFILGSPTCSNKHVYSQQDTESDNHNENVTLTKEDQKIIQTVSQLLGIEAEKLKQVRLEFYAFPVNTCFTSKECLKYLLIMLYMLLLRLPWSDK